MGHMTAAGFAELVAEGQVSLVAALRYHLTANHYPPVSEVWVAPCMAAIAAANEGDFNRPVDVPWGPKVTAFRLIEGLHLDAFIGLEEE